MYKGKFYVIKLGAADLGQLMDGLECRAAAWEKTAVFHRAGVAPDGCLVEECNDAEEAERIATHYRSIIAAIVQQTEHQP
jgi:hypothetical protein